MKDINQRNSLILAIGNNGRQDDGLGWEFAANLEKNGDFRGDVEYRYQLQVEDAELITNYENVVFVDACKEKLENGIEWRSCPAAVQFHFSTHALEPGSVLYLSKDLYGHTPEAWLLLIEGYMWELEMGLSDAARKNLERAMEFFSCSV